MKQKVVFLWLTLKWESQPTYCVTIWNRMRILTALEVFIHQLYLKIILTFTDIYLYLTWDYLWSYKLNDNKLYYNRAYHITRSELPLLSDNNKRDRNKQLSVQQQQQSQKSFTWTNKCVISSFCRIDSFDLTLNSSDNWLICFRFWFNKNPRLVKLKVLLWWSMYNSPCDFIN